MKIIVALAVAHLFLLATGSDAPEEPKEVGCFYSGIATERHEGLNPEDIDVSICSHLMYLYGKINDETDEIEVKSTFWKWNTREGWKDGTERIQRGQCQVRPSDKSKSSSFLEPVSADGVLNQDQIGIIPKLAKLKEVNPDLKLILFISYVYEESLLEPSRRTKIINNGVKWLNESGFDGLEFFFDIERDNRLRMADLFCDMKSEFDKYGYVVTTLVDAPLSSRPIPGKEDIINKLARCCDHLTLARDKKARVTHRFAPMYIIREYVDWFIENGIPTNKIIIAIPSFGAFLRLEDPNETGLGANISGTVNDKREISGDFSIRYKEVLRQLNDSSLEWTTRRDENTGEVYSFSKTGLWTSYEDTDSMSFKARYVLEKGLKGMSVVPIDMDDAEGIGGEGRFPLTRAVYKTFRPQHQS